MNITILAPGSRGDVQPYVALGNGLLRAGHAVTVLTYHNFEQLVTSYGLGFVALDGDVEAVAQSMQALVEQGNMAKILARQAETAAAAAYQSATQGLIACADADLLIAGLGGLFSGAALAEKLHKPLLQAYVLPFTPTSAFASVLTPLPQSPLTAWANYPSHQLARQAIWQTSRAADGKARAEVLNLPTAPFFGPFATLKRQTQPILYGYSPRVLSPPKDWAANIHVTGYWFLDPPNGWHPPSELAAFLAAGLPPVYIGFGSMPNSKPEVIADLVVQALARSGQRGVLSAGWGGLKKADLPDSVYMVGSLPHSWLLPQMAAVVHHGGAGTTAAGLAAGVPSVITPFFADQPFWAKRVAELGVGPQPIPRKQLTLENLAAAIQSAVSDQAMRARARTLGEHIRAEDGIGQAVAAVAQANRRS